MAGGNKPALPIGPPPGSFAGDQHRALQREFERAALAIRQLREGRIANTLALDAAPTGGQWAQGDIVRNSRPSRTISASNTTTFVIWGWQYIDEGLGTLTWSPMRFYDDQVNPSPLGSTGWRDNLSALSAAAVGGGVNKPTWGTIRNGIEGWLFSPSVDQELWTSFHIDHDYAAGTALYPHIHLVPLDNIGGVVRIGFEYTYAKGHNQAAFPATSTIYLNCTITASSQYRHLIFETPDVDAIPGTDIETDGVLMIRVFRNASDPGDTFSTTVAAVFMDLHYQTDHLATLEKVAPFTPLSWGGNFATGGGVTQASITATHTGSGEGVYVGNSGTELVFRRLQEGTGISLTVSAGAIRITNTGAAGGFNAASQTATNIGAGVGVYEGNDGTTLRFRTLVEGSGISITVTGSIVRITNTGAAGGFNAASQTATNVGVGTGLYDGNDGTTLRFRVLQGGSGISITQSGSVVRIASTVAANPWTAASMTATTTGVGTSVYAGNNGTELTFRNVQAGTGISVTTSAGAIRITSTVTGGGGNSITTTAYASQPSGTVAGTLFLPSDGVSIKVATGTGWSRWGPIYRFYDPPTTGWEKRGAVTSSYTQSFLDGSMRMKSINGTPSSGPCWFERAITSVSATHNVTVCIVPTWTWQATGFFGLFVGDSASSKALFFGLQGPASAPMVLHIRPATSITNGATLGTTITAGISFPVITGVPIWLRIQSDATNNRRRFYYSEDGLGWVETFSISYTGSASFLGHDTCGLVLNSQNGNVVMLNRQIMLHSWKEN